MRAPARNSLAVIGAGPVGLETAALALEQGLDVHVFERGEVGAHPLAWGHVRMFTPWSRNVGAASRRALERAGIALPDGDALPTGAELVERLLAPLAATAEIKPRIHERAQVLHVSRFGALKGEAIGDPARRSTPFRLLVRDAGGHESVLHAFAVVDASGVYGSPNWAGTGGIPARGEVHLAPQMGHHAEDVLGLRRERHAGRSTMVIGGGATAATTVTGLASLAAQFDRTSVTWVTRSRAGRLAGEVADDSLPARAALFAEAQALRAGGNPAVRWIGGAEVEGFEYNSATHRYRVALDDGERAWLEEADEIVVNTGFGPDNSIYRELQVHECYGSRGPMKLSVLLLGAGGDCTQVPAAGLDALRSPEPDFFVLGAKSYARYNTFLLQAGYAQAAEVVPELARAASEVASR